MCVLTVTVGFTGIALASVTSKETDTTAPCFAGLGVAAKFEMAGATLSYTVPTLPAQAALRLPAGSATALAAMAVTLTSPWAVGVTLNVQALPFCVNDAGTTLPFETETPALFVKATGSEKVTVKVSGETLVGLVWLQTTLSIMGGSRSREAKALVATAGSAGWPPVGSSAFHLNQIGPVTTGPRSVRASQTAATVFVPSESVSTPRIWRFVAMLTVGSPYAENALVSVAFVHDSPAFVETISPTLQAFVQGFDSSAAAQARPLPSRIWAAAWWATAISKWVSAAGPGAVGTPSPFAATSLNAMLVAVMSSFQSLADKAASSAPSGFQTPSPSQFHR